MSVPKTDGLPLADAPMMLCGWGSRDRTYDLRIQRPLLSQLSYTPIRKTEMLARLGLSWSLPGAHDIVPTRIRQVGYVWICC